MDRISILPQALIEQILEKLPLVDRVRTSVLSSKWRFLWIQVPSLIFDRDFHTQLSKGTGFSVSQYLSVINCVVLQFPRNARDVTLFIPQGDQRGVLLGPNQLPLAHGLIMRFLCDDGVERLKVDVDHYTPTRFPVPLSFPIVSTAVRLTHLEVNICSLTPPSSTQIFPCLATLILRSHIWVRHSTAAAASISRFMSSCPKLQKIVLSCLYFPSETLDINCPELRDLTVGGMFNCLRLTNAGNIEAVALDITVESGVHALFQSMVKVEKATFGRGFYELVAADHLKAESSHYLTVKFPIYDQLKSLTFDRIDFEDTLQIVYLWNCITSCVNLTELSIRVMISGPVGARPPLNYVWILEELKDEVKRENAFKHLLTVNFVFVTVSNIEMKIIELLLRCSPALKLMHIRVCSVKSRYVERMKKFHRASSRARVDVHIN